MSKKKVVLTISEYEVNGEKKKKRVNVGRIHNYEGGGEAIVLDAALCAAIAAKAQAALNAGEDAIWLSIFEDTPQGQPQQQTNYNQTPQAAPQPTYQNPAPVQQGVQNPQQQQGPTAAQPYLNEKPF